MNVRRRQTTMRCRCRRDDCRTAGDGRCLGRVLVVGDDWARRAMSMLGVGKCVDVGVAGDDDAINKCDGGRRTANNAANGDGDDGGGRNAMGRLAMVYDALRRRCVGRRAAGGDDVSWRNACGAMCNAMRNAGGARRRRVTMVAMMVGGVDDGWWWVSMVVNGVGDGDDGDG